MTQTQRVSLALTAANLVLFVGIIFGQARSLAAKQPVERVLRGRAIEIVDDHGNVRFGVSIEGPSREGGKLRPERVLVRIGSPGAGPGLKLVSSVEGTDLGLMHNDRPYVQLSAKDSTSFVKIVDAKGKERLITP